MQQKLTQRLQTQHPQLTIEFEPIFAGADAMNTPAEAEIVRLTESLTGFNAESVAYATEAPFLSQLGTDVIVLGPGSIDQAHQPDEYLPLNEIEPTVELLQKLIKKLCLD